MKLYLADNACEYVFVALLRKAGHEVMVPADVNYSGRKDPEHLLLAIQRGLVFLTYNYKDFLPLHGFLLDFSVAYASGSLQNFCDEP